MFAKLLIWFFAEVKMKIFFLKIAVFIRRFMNINIGSRNMFSQVWSEMKDAFIFTFYMTAGQRMDDRLFPLHRTHLFYNMS